MVAPRGRVVVFTGTPNQASSAGENPLQTDLGGNVSVVTKSQRAMGFDKILD